MAVAASISLVARLAYVARPVLRPVTSRIEYPYHLPQLLDAADQNGIAVEQLEIFILEGDLMAEYFWKTEASPELIELVIANRRLSPTAREPWLWEKMAECWNIATLDQVDFFAGTGLVMMHDKTNQRLYFYHLHFD